MAMTTINLSGLGTQQYRANNEKFDIGYNAVYDDGNPNSSVPGLDPTIQTLENQIDADLASLMKVAGLKTEKAALLAKKAEMLEANPNADVSAINARIQAIDTEAGQLTGAEKLAYDCLTVDANGQMSFDSNAFSQLSDTDKKSLTDWLSDNFKAYDELVSDMADPAVKASLDAFFQSTDPVNQGGMTALADQVKAMGDFLKPFATEALNPNSALGKMFAQSPASQLGTFITDVEGKLPSRAELEAIPEGERTALQKEQLKLRDQLDQLKKDIKAGKDIGQNITDINATLKGLKDTHQFDAYPTSGVNTAEALTKLGTDFKGSDEQKMFAFLQGTLDKIDAKMALLIGDAQVGTDAYNQIINGEEYKALASAKTTLSGMQDKLFSGESIEGMFADDAVPNLKTMFSTLSGYGIAVFPSAVGQNYDELKTFVENLNGALSSIRNLYGDNGTYSSIVVPLGEKGDATEKEFKTNSLGILTVSIGGGISNRAMVDDYNAAEKRREQEEAYFKSKGGKEK